MGHAQLFKRQLWGSRQEKTCKRVVSFSRGLMLDKSGKDPPKRRLDGEDLEKQVEPVLECLLTKQLAPVMEKVAMIWSTLDQGGSKCSINVFLSRKEFWVTIVHSPLHIAMGGEGLLDKSQGEKDSSNPGQCHQPVKDGHHLEQT